MEEQEARKDRRRWWLRMLAASAGLVLGLALLAWAAPGLRLYYYGLRYRMGWDPADALRTVAGELKGREVSPRTVELLLGKPMQISIPSEFLTGEPMQISMSKVPDSGECRYTYSMGAEHVSWACNNIGSFNEIGKTFCFREGRLESVRPYTLGNSFFDGDDKTQVVIRPFVSPEELFNARR